VYICTNSVGPQPLDNMWRSDYQTKDQQIVLYTCPSSTTYTADTAVGDLSVDISLLPRLGLFRASAIDQISNECSDLYLEFTPLHVTLDGAGIMAQPAEELVILSRHFCDCD